MKYKIFLLCLLALLLFFGFYKISNSDTLPVKEAISPLATSTPLFEAIALCESGNDPHAKNAVSSASGRFQFMANSWYHYGRKLWGEKFYEKNIWNYKDNTELAWYVYTHYGVNDWISSENCWSKSI